MMVAPTTPAAILPAVARRALAAAGASLASTSRERTFALAACLLLHAVALSGLLRLAPAAVAPVPVIEMELVPAQALQPAAATARSPASLPQPLPLLPATPRLAAAAGDVRPVPSPAHVMATPAAELPAEQPAPVSAPAVLLREPTAPAPVRESPAAVPRTAPQELPVTAPSFDAAYLENPAPRYPPAALRLRESGRVLVSVMVSATGLAERVELARSSGSPRLDQAALETVRRWRFEPARQGDRAVAAQVTVPLVFRLDE